MFEHVFETGIPPEALDTFFEGDFFQHLGLRRLFQEWFKTMVSRRWENKNLCEYLGNTYVSACLRNRNPSRSLGHIFLKVIFF